MKRVTRDEKDMHENSIRLECLEKSAYIHRKNDGDIKKIIKDATAMAEFVLNIEDDNDKSLTIVSAKKSGK